MKAVNINTKKREIVCREIADSVDRSLTNRAFEFLYGSETTIYFDAYPEADGEEWADAICPDIPKYRKTLLHFAVKDGRVMEDEVSLLASDSREAGLLIGIFVGAKLAGASRQQLLDMAKQLAHKFELQEAFHLKIDRNRTESSKRRQTRKTRKAA